jgi:hypothetical protein
LLFYTTYCSISFNSNGLPKKSELWFSQIGQVDRDTKRKFVYPPKMTGHLSESRRITRFKCRISRHHNTDHYGKITPKAVILHQSAVFFFCSNPAAPAAMSGLPTSPTSSTSRMGRRSSRYVRIFNERKQNNTPRRTRSTDHVKISIP